MHVPIAHYYCELAEKVQAKNNLEQAKNYLRQALEIDNRSVRASLLQAGIEMVTGQYKSAIRSYKQVKFQDPEYISETIFPLSRCHECLREEQELIDYLQKCLAEYPRISVVLVLAEYIRKCSGNRAAIEFIAEQIHRHPSLRGVEYLTKLYLEQSHGDTRDKLSILRNLIENLLANKPVYRCMQCGFAAKTLYWQCPRCRGWNVVKPIHGLEGD
jgi:lipopolysaccharide biosynthesis regulator YciM